MTTYYKVLHEDGRAFNGGTGTWNTPHGRRPGKWMPEITDIVPCKRGYHVCEADDLLRWLGPAIFEVEVRGMIIRHHDKSVVSQARLLRNTHWNNKAVVSFALDCATRALNSRKHNRQSPPNKRSFDAITAGRKYLKGEISKNEMFVAYNAARSVTHSAANSAYYAAKSVVNLVDPTNWPYSARLAAHSAKESAYYAALSAMYAGRAAEVEWQQKRLFEYITGKRSI